MLFSYDDQTIIAQATPTGSGALAMVRMSGCAALEVAAQLSSLASGKEITSVPSHTVHYGTVVEGNGSIIDHVMFIVMHGPRTFTGQHTVEITCHNNPFIIEAIIARAIACGARLAHEGEFSKRAVLNKKMDVVQAEAINELIHAGTRMALKTSLAQVQGSFSAWLQALEKDLLKALALSEASFEFIDEAMEFGPQIDQIVTTVLNTIATIKKTFDQQQHIRQGVRVALIGSVNAGKSSLFNALLGKQRAIVTAIAGTTRDVIEAGVYKNDAYLTLVDTAGLRQTDDVIEQEGIARSQQEAAQADVVLVVIDQSRAMTAAEYQIYRNLITQYCHKVILVYTKADVPAQVQQSFSVGESVVVSSTSGHNLAILEQRIEKKIAALYAQSEVPFLVNQRQFRLLMTLEAKLLQLQPLLQGSVAYELVSYHLNDALSDMSELTGKTISEQGMDTIFREFCIGK